MPTSPVDALSLSVCLGTTCLAHCDAVGEERHPTHLYIRPAQPNSPAGGIGMRFLVVDTGTVNYRTSVQADCYSFSKLSHHLNQVGFSFKADTGQLGHNDVAIFDPYAVRETAIGLEQVRVALVAAKTQPRCDVQ